MKRLSLYAAAFAVLFSCVLMQPSQAMAAEHPTAIEITSEDPALTFEDTLFTLLNAERAKHGLHAYRLDETLDMASKIRGYELTSVFSHKRNGQESFSTILDEYEIPFTKASEIIAAGQTSPEQVLADWLQSPKHAKRILHAEYTKIGIAHNRNAEGMDVWEILFVKE